MKAVVGFSGGIDSQACSLLVRRQFRPEDVILLNTQAGRNEHPLTVGFVKWYSDNVFPVVEVIPLIRDLGDVGTRCGATRARRQQFKDDDELTFDRLAFVKGRFPSRKAQFCTEYLKLAPQKRWCLENLHDKGQEYERYIGVRADESNDRAKLPADQWDDYFDTILHRPLLKWTKQQCFDFVLEAGEEINPLYRLG